MSQFYNNISSVNPPPTFLTQVTTDVKDGPNSTASPGTVKVSSNNINLLGGQSSLNNTNGIRTDANPNDSANGYIELTNRITGTATTTDDSTPQTIYSFDMGGTAGTYLFEIRVIGFNATDGTSAGYNSWRVVRTNGTTGTSIATTPGIQGEEGTMEDVLVVNGISTNNATLTVTGLAGKTIYWRALTTYIFVSA